MIVSMYMSTDVATVPPHADVGLAVERMAQSRVHCLPVVDRGTLVGVVSKTDVLRLGSTRINPFSAEARAHSETGFTIDQAMSHAVTTVGPEVPIDAAAEILDTKRLSVLVVVKDRSVVGMLSRTDILRAFREIVFSARATRFTLVADEGIDVAGQVLADCGTHGLELTAYVEHRHDKRRYVLVSITGPRETIDQTIHAAWMPGVQLLQVQRPSLIG